MNQFGKIDEVYLKHCRNLFLEIEKLHRKWHKTLSHKERAELAWQAADFLDVIGEHALSWCLDTCYLDTVAAHVGIDAEELIQFENECPEEHESRFYADPVIGDRPGFLDILGRPSHWADRVSPAAQRAAMLEVLATTRFALPIISAKQLGINFSAAKLGVMVGLLDGLQEVKRRRQHKVVEERYHQLNMICAVHFLKGAGCTIQQARCYWANMFDDVERFHEEAFRDWERRELVEFLGNRHLNRVLKFHASLGAVESSGDIALKRQYVERFGEDEGQKKLDKHTPLIPPMRIMRYFEDVIQYRTFLGLPATPDSGFHYPDFAMFP